jgi:hypothetical protein
VTEFARLSVKISAEWRPKTVTTDPPKLIPHTEWALAVLLEAAAPIRSVALTYLPSETLWGLQHDEASTRVELLLRFTPFAWSTSDTMHVGVGSPVAISDRPQS